MLRWLTRLGSLTQHIHSGLWTLHQPQSRSWRRGKWKFMLLTESRTCLLATQPGWPASNDKPSLNHTAVASNSHYHGKGCEFESQVQVPVIRVLSGCSWFLWLCKDFLRWLVPHCGLVINWCWLVQSETPPSTEQHWAIYVNTWLGHKPHNLVCDEPLPNIVVLKQWIKGYICEKLLISAMWGLTWLKLLWKV